MLKYCYSDWILIILDWSASSCYTGTYLRRSVERISIKDGLDHNERLGQILPSKVVTVIRRFIWTVIEDLQEWGASQMEHELHQKDEWEEKCQEVAKTSAAKSNLHKQEILWKNSLPLFNSSVFFPYQSFAALDQPTKLKKHLFLPSWIW